MMLYPVMGAAMMTLWTCLAFVSAQTPAPAKPAVPPAIPPGVIAKSDAFPDAMQWGAMACTARLTSSSGELGTAVVVAHRDGSAFLLTANHVVAENADRKLEFFTKENYLAQPLVLRITESPVFRAPQADLALLKVSMGKNTLPVMRIPPPGPKARPKKFPAAALSIGCSNAAQPTCRVEEIHAKILVRKANESGTFFWQTAQPSVEGRSGGPLLDKNGFLIGICAATQDSKGYYSHLDEIHVALKEGGYSWIWESNKGR